MSKSCLAATIAWTAGLALACTAPARSAEPDCVSQTDVDVAKIDALFSGNIDATSVAAFIARNDRASIVRVVVRSAGGDIRQALILGNWMLDHGVDVEVTGFCNSSCANYLFTAGHRKIIDDGSIVIWHGSAWQKNLRIQADACTERIDALERKHVSPPAEGADPLVVEKLTCDDFIGAIHEQDAFFRRGRVNEYLTRMGQEPRDFGAL